jgi:hypothetical protein
MSTVATTYRELLAAREAQVVRWSRRELAVSIARLVAIVVGSIAAWLAVQNRLFALGWAVLPFLVFAVLVVLHGRILERRDRLRRAADFFRAGLARLDGTWTLSGDGGARYTGEGAIGGAAHPYAADLDLFGRGSLFQLLDTTRTRAGADTLASWLLAPAAIAEVRARQAAVAELRPRLDLREALWTLGTVLRSELESEVLTGWASAPSQLERLRWLRFALPIVAAANIAAAAGWAFLGWGPSPLVGLLALEILGHLWLRARVAATIEGVERASSDLSLIGALLGRLEAERLETPWLASRLAELRHGGVSSGRTIALLERRVDRLASRRNALFAPIGALLLWTTQLAFALDRWRQLHGAAVIRWLEVVGEIEALCAFATRAFEQSEDVFPELLEAGDARIVGTAMAHPLLPRERGVPNDLELGGDVRASMVSGSNMSGKSTYLRTCGLHVVLAMAGAPVPARTLRLTRLQVGASIRIQDSLLEGASKFYAEIKRLRQILELTKSDLPVLFLLDEILHGTNSHDRRIGAEAVVRALIARGAIGLVTTHDLALADLAAATDGRLRNVHFEDTLEGDRVLFDYRLRPGVVEHSNALALMREIGLEV